MISKGVSVMGKKFNCMICGEELSYLNESKEMECYYCKKKIHSNASCKHGHYVCDSCHSLDAFEVIKNYCVSSTSVNPLEIAMDLMKHPSVKMHGPEHHFLVPSVLLTAYLNKTSERENLSKLLQECEKRSKNVLGGFCGFYGCCGAAVGTGIFMSLILGATPLSKEKWGLCNLMTSKSLEAISSFGGPRCCKRDSFLAIETSIDFIKENLNIELEENKNIYCNYSKINSECLKENCKFYNIPEIK